MADISSLSDEQLAQIAGVSLQPPAPATPAAPAAPAAAPLNVRNNNPGNMRGPDGGFASYDSPQAGLAHMESDLTHKVSGQSPIMRARFGDGYTPTIRNVISTWAPPSENNTANYIDYVSKGSGIDPDAPLAVADVQKIMQPMIHMEGGAKASSYFGDLMKSAGGMLVGSANAAENEPAITPSAPAAPAAKPSSDAVNSKMAKMTDDELAEIAGVKIDDEMPRSGEGFWDYQLRNMGRSVTKPVGEMVDSVKAGVKDITDIADPKTWDPTTWDGPASAKLQSDLIQGEYLKIPLDVIKRMNEGFSSNPASKALMGPMKIVTAPVAPIMNAGVRGLEAVGVDPAIPEFAGNIAPLALRGKGAPESVVPPARMARVTNRPAPEAAPVTPVAPEAAPQEPIVGPAGALPPEPAQPMPQQAPTAPAAPPVAPVQPVAPPAAAAPTARGAFDEFNARQAERTAPPPDAMLKTDRGQPLLVDKKSVDAGVRDLGTFLEKDGINLNDVAARLEKAQKIDPNATALDVMASGAGDIPTGGNALGLAKSIAQSPGQGRALASDLVQRGYEARKDISGAMDDALKGSDFYKKLSVARETQKNSGKMFDEAYMEVSHPESPRLLEFKALPNVNKGLERGLALERQDAVSTQRQFKPEEYGLDAEGKQIPGVKPTMRQWATARRGIDAMINDEFDPIKGRFTPEGQSLIGVRNSLVSELNRLNPKWREANDLFSTQESIQNYARMGRTISKMDPHEVKAIFTNPKIAAADKAAFASGAGRYWANKLGEGPTTTNPINALLTDNFRERLRAMIQEKGAYERLMDRLNLHKVKGRVNGIMTGSDTAANQAFQGAPKSTLAGTALRAAGHGLEPGMMIGKLGDAIDKALQKNFDKMSENSRTVAMRILTTKDPAVLRYAAKKAGHK